MNPRGMDVEKEVLCYLSYPADPVPSHFTFWLNISSVLRIHDLLPVELNQEFIVL